MKGALLLRLGIGVLAFMAVLATLLEIAREDDIDVQSIPVLTEKSDSLRAELQRCRDLGDAALNDQDCVATWIETRRRFLTPAPTSDPEE
ncbi:putative entry exclusion protein TrbK-alt [uncultured Sulfitobacter sp.]|uniref:putative entry exclusion protein TrbK-alt n=1 Tax=uncultured Sulfitobacter sp. TaxID=191468 RepID=UPI0030D851F4|tara:strand:+ start:142523 stop:142792 length:270 start_codon:yes stop_codon:yes gene_type:complete